MTMHRAIAAALVLLTVVPGVAGVPDLPRTPVAAGGVLYAQPFTLETPFRSDWSAERPEVREGMLLVIEAEPALLFARQTAEPVLYAGGQVAIRVSFGHESGRAVVIVPGPFDLSRDAVWFGSPGLPERVDATLVAEESVRAREARIAPFPAGAVRAARLRGGAAAHFGSRVELLQAAAALMREYGVR